MPPESELLAVIEVIGGKNIVFHVVVNNTNTNTKDVVKKWPNIDILKEGNNEYLLFEDKMLK